MTAPLLSVHNLMVRHRDLVGVADVLVDEPSKGAGAVGCGKPV
jgi:hypothetical protein